MYSDQVEHLIDGLNKPSRTLQLLSLSSSLSIAFCRRCRSRRRQITRKFTRKVLDAREFR